MSAVNNPYFYQNRNNYNGSDPSICPHHYHHQTNYCSSTTLRQSNQNRSQNRYGHIQSNNMIVNTRYQQQHLSMNTKKQNINKKKNNTTKPIHPYLESNAISFWFTRNTRQAFNIYCEPGTKDYILATASLYDELYRTCYELHLWEVYLQMSKKSQYWSEEVLQSTNTRCNQTNNRFIQTKINQLEDYINELTDISNDSKAQLTAYWAQWRVLERSRMYTELFTIDIPEMSSEEKYSIDSIDELNICIKDYILQCTRHAKKMMEIKIELAEAQMEDYKHLFIK